MKVSKGESPTVTSGAAAVLGVRLVRPFEDRALIMTQPLGNKCKKTIDLLVALLLKGGVHFKGALSTWKDPLALSTYLFCAPLASSKISFAEPCGLRSWPPSCNQRIPGPVVLCLERQNPISAKSSTQQGCAMATGHLRWNSPTMILGCNHPFVRRVLLIRSILYIKPGL